MALLQASVFSSAVLGLDPYIVLLHAQTSLHNNPSLGLGLTRSECFIFIFKTSLTGNLAGFVRRIDYQLTIIDFELEGF